MNPRAALLTSGSWFLSSSFLVPREFDYVPVGVATEDLFHTELAVAAFLEFDAVASQGCADSVHVGHLQRHVIGPAQPRRTCQLLARILDDVELAIAQGIPGAAEMEAWPGDLRESQHAAEELPAGGQVLGGERYMMEFHKRNHGYRLGPPEGFTRRRKERKANR